MKNSKFQVLPSTAKILAEFGKNIKLARLRRKLSAEQVAERANISRGAFLAGTTRDRWVIDIDSLDTSNGTAIIKVGENSLPVTKGSTVTVSCTYSWREWNLLHNGEVRVLRLCKDPFEKLTR